ncbi:MAG: sigma-70 family RNA polymerase sigma factor [Bacillota bacterium]|nr:sigma-70 family RNA polymerase sigma factor [Bacillota bacterium]
MELNQLLLMAKNGDKNAIEQILIMFTPLVMKNALSIFIAGYDVDDLKQIGYISIVNAVNKFDFEKCTSFKAYVKNAVQNNFRCLIRDKCKDNATTSLNIKGADELELEDLIADSNTVEDEIIYLEELKEMNEKEKVLKIALGKLSEEERELIEYTYFRNISLKEYAASKGIKYVTCSKRKQRIIMKLRAAFE